MANNRIIEEAIKFVSEGTEVTFPVNGVSMLPFIVGGRDSVVLVKPETPQAGDIVLAWVDVSHYVIHRIISIAGDEVTLMGDGNLGGHEFCHIADIAARADYAVGADGRRRYLYSPAQKVFSRLWRWLLPVRRYLLAIYRRIR